jgi:hypothetical protein
MPEPIPPTDNLPLADLTAVAPTDTHPQREERRRDPRHLAECLVHCKATVGKESQASNAVLLDVSRMGVSLMSTRPVEPGAYLVVHLPGEAPEHRALDLPARAVHCARLTAGPFIVGAVFGQPLDEAALAYLDACGALPARR